MSYHAKHLGHGVVLHSTDRPRVHVQMIPRIQRIFLTIIDVAGGFVDVSLEMIARRVTILSSQSTGLDHRSLVVVSRCTCGVLFTGFTTLATYCLWSCGGFIALNLRCVFCRPCEVK